MLVSIGDKSGNCSRQRATVLLEPLLSSQLRLLAEIWKWHFSKGLLASDSVEFSLWKAIKTNGKKRKLLPTPSFHIPKILFLMQRTFHFSAWVVYVWELKPIFIKAKRYIKEKKKKRKKLCIFVRLSPRSLRRATLTVNLILWNCSHKHSISGGSWVFLRHHPRFLHILQTHSKSQMLDSLSQKRGREDF